MSAIKELIDETIKKYVWENHPTYDGKELIIEHKSPIEYHIRINEGDEPLIIKKEL